MKTIKLDQVLAEKFHKEETKEEVKAFVIERTNQLLETYPEAYVFDPIGEKEEIDDEITLSDLYSRAEVSVDENRRPLDFEGLNKEANFEKLTNILMDGFKEAIVTEGIDGDFNVEVVDTTYKMNITDGKINVYDEDGELDELDLYVVLDAPINYYNGETTYYPMLEFTEVSLSIAGIRDLTIGKVKEYAE